MTSPAKSVFYFSLYLYPLGALLAIAPNAALTVMGAALTTEPWIRVLGIVAIAIGFYYSRAALAEQREFICATVWGRSAAAAGFLLLVATGTAPLLLTLFAACDLAGALWTGWALASERHQPHAAPAGHGRWATKH